MKGEKKIKTNLSTLEANVLTDWIACTADVNDRFARTVLVDCVDDGRIEAVN